METNNLSKKIRQTALTIFIVAAVLVVLFGKQFALTVFASTGKVTATTANVRSAASTTSDAVASLSKGDTVEIKSQTTGTDGLIWYEITVNATTTGYIRSDLVEITDGTTPTTSGSADTTTTTTTTTTPPTANAEGITPVEPVSGTTTADVNVRADASTNSEIVAKAANGLTLTVTGTKQGTDGNTWYYLSFTKDGVSTTGYIRSDYVRLSGDLKEPSAESPEEEPVQTTTETVETTIQKHWDTQEQADGWFLLDYEQGKQYNIDNLFETNTHNAELLEKQEGKIKSLRTILIIVILVLVATIVAAVFFFMKWKDLDDRAAFAEAEKERAKRIAGHGEGRRPERSSERSSRPASREGTRREAAGERRRPAEGAARPERQPSDRPARAQSGERRSVDVQRGQSSHTVRPADGERRSAEADRRAEERRAAEDRRAAEPVREAVREPEPEDEAPVEYIEKKPHRSARPQSEPIVKDHHRKQLVDDDDDEFEFGFLNWDDDDK